MATCVGQWTFPKFHLWGGEEYKLVYAVCWKCASSIKSVKRCWWALKVLGMCCLSLKTEPVALTQFSSYRFGKVIAKTLIPILMCLIFKMYYCGFILKHICHVT